MSEKKFPPRRGESGIVSSEKLHRPDNIGGGIPVSLNVVGAVVVGAALARCAESCSVPHCEATQLITAPPPYLCSFGYYNYNHRNP